MRRVLVLCLLVSCGGGEDQVAEGTCANVAGVWQIDGCGGDECTITQTGCAAALDCEGGTASYTGSVAGNQVSFTGRNGAGLEATCNATVSGGSMSGSCKSAGLPSCPFTGSRP